MNSNQKYISLKLNKWSEFELNDLFSTVHFPLNKIGKSIGFFMIYDNLDDAFDSGENIENLVEIKIDTIDKQMI